MRIHTPRLYRPPHSTLCRACDFIRSNTTYMVFFTISWNRSPAVLSPCTLPSLRVMAFHNDDRHLLLYLLDREQPAVVDGLPLCLLQGFPLKYKVPRKPTTLCLLYLSCVFSFKHQPGRLNPRTGRVQCKRLGRWRWSWSRIEKWTYS